MLYRYGSYLSPLNEAGILIQREAVTSEASGLQLGFRERWTLNGFLQATDPYTLTALLTLLELAFARNNQPLQLLANDGFTVLRQLAPLGALGGTRVVQGPQYLDDGTADAEYSTYRRYQCIVEGGYAYAGVPGTALLAYHESITTRGTGGPRFVYRQPLTGYPQKQLVAENTPVLVTQRGEAVGLTAYPFYPAPIWPEAEHEDRRELEFGNPKKTGGNVGAVYVEWPVRWTYVFEDIALPESANPNVVTGI